MSDSLLPTDPPGGVLYSLEVVTELTGLTRSEVLWCYRAGLVQPAATADELLQFDDTAVYRLRRLAQVRAAYATTWAGAHLICELLDEVERLRAELEFWRNR